MTPTRLALLLPVAAAVLTGAAGCAAGDPGADGSAGSKPAASAKPSGSATPSKALPAVVRPSSVPPAALAWPPRPGTVAIVGDSLTVGAEPYLSGDFAEVGSAAQIVLARVGIPTSTGLAALREAGSDLPHSVLVALGTNDTSATAADVVAWLDEARRIIGPGRRLVWVNLSIRNPEYRNDEVINEVLAESAQRDPRLLVLDWAGYAAAKGIVNTPDGVHYDAAGYRQRAHFYTCAMVATQECAPYQLH